MKTNFRPLNEIAREVRETWKTINPFAEAYLKPLFRMNLITDSGARSQIAYFLSNTSGWRGEDARRIKAELNAMLDYAENNGIPW